MTEQLHFHISLSCVREGNGNPLQCSCLENPRYRGAWWAAVYGVTQSRTRLKWLSSSSSSSTYLEPHILECEVKWALGSITMNKASGGDGIPVELWWCDDERWCCGSAALNMSANLEKSAVATGLENTSFHSNPKERQCQRMLKVPQNCTHLTR